MTKRENDQEILQMAIVGLIKKREVLEAKMQAIRDQIAGRDGVAAEAPTKLRRRMSKATREKMRISQQARWKKAKAAARKGSKR